MLKRIAPTLGDPERGDRHPAGAVARRLTMVLQKVYHAVTQIRDGSGDAGGDHDGRDVPRAINGSPHRR